MNVMNVVRIAKIVALLAFVLPWVAVSCNNVDVATASGIELIQGKMSSNPDAEKQMNQRMGSMFGVNPGSLEAEGGFGGVRENSTAQQIPELGLNFFGIAAAAVIVIGLALSFMGKGRTTARNVLVTSLIGMVLVFGTVWWWKDQIKKQDGGSGGGRGAAESPFGGGGGMDAMGAQMADQILQERFGYWLALGALAVAAGAGALAMGGGAAGTKPDAAPPAA